MLETGARGYASRTEIWGIMLTDFYISFSATCFTVLGLWLVVVQQRYRAWARDPALKTPLVTASRCTFRCPGS